MSKRATPLPKCLLPTPTAIRLPGSPAEVPGSRAMPASLDADRLAYMVDLIAELQEMADRAGHGRLALLLCEAGEEARLRLDVSSG